MPLAVLGEALHRRDLGPLACTANNVHDLTDSPSISTVHAPQFEVLHPTIVPVRFSTSRK
jgi:hypothetical protein